MRSKNDRVPEHDIVVTKTEGKIKKKTLHPAEYLGAPDTPAGGSCCNLLKSLINLLLAGVDIFSKNLATIFFLVSFPVILEIDLK